MSTGPQEDMARLERLSALADGEVDASELADACACWRGDIEIRTTWHAYHLIGDVLRSDDLAADPARDAAFLAALRGRLASEPVVFAPSASPSIGSRPVGGVSASGRAWDSRWWVGSAVAASFVAMAGAYTWMKPNPAPAPALAQVAPSPVVTARVEAPREPALASAGEGFRVVSMNGGMVRDPRLDAYLAAHKQFAGSTALGVPSAFLRSATVENQGR